MLVSNSMRFCTDIFGLIDDVEEPEVDDTPQDTTDDSGQSSTTTPVEVVFNKQALLVSKTALNCANKSEVNGIVITGAEPSGTKRRFLWKFDDKVYKLNSAGNASELTGDLTAAYVLKNGNPASGLNALTSVPAFVGKKIFPIIALQAPSNADEFPTAAVELKTKTSTDTLTDTKESIVYELTQGETPTISEITADTTIKGNASVDIKVRLQNANESWTDYMTLANAADKEALAVQFKFVYKVTTTDGSDSAKVNFINIDHTLGKSVVSGDNAYLYSIVADYDIPLQMCYVNVRHYPLVDSKIEAYVNFMHPTQHRELIQIGTGTGSRQELKLGVGGVKDNNIVASTIQLYVDGVSIEDFSYNSEISTVVLSAKKNSSIYASYDYERDDEVWRKMTLNVTEPYTDDETVMSRFSYTLPDSEATDKTISNIRIHIKRPSGTVSNYSLGTATGKKQLFVLPHQAKASSIKFSEDVDWEYDNDSYILSVVAKKNTALVISYKWTGENVGIVSWAAGWAIKP